MIVTANRAKGVLTLEYDAPVVMSELTVPLLKDFIAKLTKGLAVLEAPVPVDPKPEPAKAPVDRLNGVLDTILAAVERQRETCPCDNCKSARAEREARKLTNGPFPG